MLPCLQELSGLGPGASLGVCAVEHCRGLPVDYDPYYWREIRWDKNVPPYSQQSFDLIMEDCP